jgi:hypothetical protein
MAALVPGSVPVQAAAQVPEVVPVLVAAPIPGAVPVLVAAPIPGAVRVLVAAPIPGAVPVLVAAPNPGAVSVPTKSKSVVKPESNSVSKKPSRHDSDIGPKSSNRLSKQGSEPASKPPAKSNSKSKPKHKHSKPAPTPPSHHSSSSSDSSSKDSDSNRPKHTEASSSPPSDSDVSHSSSGNGGSGSDPPRKGGRGSSTPPKKTMMEKSQLLMAQAMLNMSKKSGDKAHLSKFKMNYHCQLPDVRLTKGEMTTSTVVINTFTKAMAIEAAAELAANRLPSTAEDWNCYFKFHLTHMTNILQEQMQRELKANPVQDSSAFWTMVYQVIIPSHLATQACHKALNEYMPWHEPVGITRWQAVVTALLNHMALLKHKQDKAKRFMVAEGRYQHLHDMINLCPVKENRELIDRFEFYKVTIDSASAKREVIKASMYEAANAPFIKYLTERWDRYSCQDLFGHKLVQGHVGPTLAPQPKAHPKPAPAPQSPIQTPPVIQPPLYQQVVTLGSQTPLIRAMAAAPAAANPGKKPTCRELHPIDEKPRPFIAVAPTGIPRTWVWPQYTNPDTPGLERWPCSYPPPPECTDKRVVYYGDWLDLQQKCSYCLSDAHKAGDCEKYKINMRKGKERQAAEQAAKEAALKGKAPAAGPSTSAAPPAKQGN